MRSSTRLLAALPLLAVLPLSFASGSAASADPGQEQDGGSGQEHGDGPLHEAMEAMQGGLRNLGRSLRSEEGMADAIEAAGRIREGLVTAVGLEPEYPEGMVDTTARQRHRIAFQRMLVETLDTTLALEDALYAGDLAAAQERFGALREQKSAGHERFQVEDDEG